MFLDKKMCKKKFRKAPALTWMASLAFLVNCICPGYTSTLFVPNSSFESPPVPQVSPYAQPDLDSWAKSPQPAWYDPAQNSDTPWDYLMGTFYNVPFPAQFIDNCDGAQAAFLFALPEAALFQDFDSIGGTNSIPSHAFKPTYNVGHSYDLAAGVIGGGGGMQAGATLELRFYYRDASSNKIVVASISITNSTALFPTNTHFIDFHVHLPSVQPADAWAGKHIGIELASTVDFGLAGGYWDIDNVRLVESIEVPNSSFESPIVPPVSPFAIPDMDAWQKTPQPAWYDPAQNADTPWDYLMGTFYNVPFPAQFIDNCDGSQAAFVFAVPQAGLFQDYNSVSGTNTTPSHAFNATFRPGMQYALTAGLIGGGGNMPQGATVQLSLYYRDASSNMVTVAATTVTNTVAVFPTNTHFVQFQVQVLGVKSADAWAGKNIGIAIESTTDFSLTGGYWDVDNVRLTETVAPDVASATAANGQINFNVLSEPGAALMIQTATDLTSGSSGWTDLRSITNVTGAGTITEPLGAATQRFFRARSL